jgi:glyoxylase-like metal-dependent hydrolase (beta-lactamase superfamily II)
MPPRPRHLLFAIAALLLSPLAASAGAADQLSAEGVQAASQMLETSALALRAAPDARLRSVELDYAGTLNWLNQGLDPSQPMRFQFRQQIFFGAPGADIWMRFEFNGPESSFERRAALRESSDDAIEAFSYSPHLVIRHLLAEPANLSLVPADGDGTIVSGTLLGRRVELSIGPDRLPRSLRYLIDDELFGDAFRVVEYRDYSDQAEVLVPRNVRKLDHGRMTQSLALSSARLGGPAPDWGQGLAPPQVSANPERLQAVRLADGIHLLNRHGGQDYHGMLVELHDGLMLLEAPAAIGDGAELAAVAASVSPKPITRIVSTHHHDDHATGTSARALASAEVLTTAGNVDYFRTMATAPRRLAFGAGGSDRRVRALSRSERIGPVRFIDIGSVRHAREHLVFYFPGHGLLFQSDMARFNADGSVEPARPQTCHLLEQIEARGLRVRQIVGGHGRPGTLDDLRQAVAHPRSQCRNPGAAGSP